MGLLDKIFDVKEVTGQIISTIDKHLPVPVDQTRKMELETELEKTLLSAVSQIDLAQAEINKAEAANPRLFVSGWRPAIGWTCAVSLACYYIPRAVAATVLWVMAVVKSGQLMAPPDIGIGDIMGLVLAMLGVAGLRTYEKKLGVQDRH